MCPLGVVTASLPCGGSKLVVRLVCLVLDLAGRPLSWTGGSAAGGLLLLGSFCVVVSGFYVWCWTWPRDSFLGLAVLLLVVSFSWGPLCGVDWLLCVVLDLAGGGFLGPVVLLLVVSFSWGPLCGVDRLVCVVLDLAGRRLSWTSGSAAGG